MDKCREEFELWLLDGTDNDEIKQFITARYTNGTYKIKSVQCSWISWQASRESMKAIKLPVLPITMPINYRIGFSNAVNRCKDAITSAGYKVEE